MGKNVAGGCWKISNLENTFRQRRRRRRKRKRNDPFSGGTHRMQKLLMKVGLSHRQHGVLYKNKKKQKLRRHPKEEGPDCPTAPPYGLCHRFLSQAAALDPPSPPHPLSQLHKISAKCANSSEQIQVPLSRRNQGHEMIQEYVTRLPDCLAFQCRTTTTPPTERQ